MRSKDGEDRTGLGLEWLIVLFSSLYRGVGAYLVLAHQVKFTVDAGYSSMFSASGFGLFGICVAVGQASAFISDRIGREKTITLAAILSIGALVSLLCVRDTSQPVLLYLYATCFGYGTGLYSPAIVVAMADIFHGRHLGARAALLLTGTGAGGAIAPWLGGYIIPHLRQLRQCLPSLYSLFWHSLRSSMDCCPSKCSPAAGGFRDHLSYALSK